MNKILIATFGVVLVGVFFAIIGESNRLHQPHSVTNPKAVQNKPSEQPQKQQLANPASQNCVAAGGTLLIKKRGDGGEYGLCEFGDNMACEEWALFRKECPVGGIKTTGYDTQAQMYCAWVGGKTFAVQNATCTLPSGKVCNDEALFNGTCLPN